MVHTKLYKKLGPLLFAWIYPPPSSLIHPTFHVSQLKAAIGSATASELPPQLTAELELCVEPADLLGYTTSPLDDSSEVLVLWQG